MRNIFCFFILFITYGHAYCVEPDKAKSMAINRSPSQEIYTSNGMLTIDRCFDTFSAQKKTEKITNIFFIEGEQNIPISEITHIGDLGIIINTEEIKVGTCVETIVDAQDGEDLVDGQKKIRILGKVNNDGNVILRYIFNDLPMPFIY